MLSSFTNWSQSASTELLILFCTEQQLHLKNKEQIYIYIKLVYLVESMSQFKGSKLWIFMEYQVGRDLKDDLSTT